MHEFYSSDTHTERQKIALSQDRKRIRVDGNVICLFLVVVKLAPAFNGVLKKSFG
jgi:hypothetical protein